MGAEFKIRAEGMRAVEKKLFQLFEKSGNLTPLMGVLGHLLVGSTRERFERGVAPDGTPWKPSQRVELEGGQTLVKSGRLRDTIHAAIGPDQVEVGSDLIYAAVHQMGATIRPVEAGALHFELPGGLGMCTAMEVIIPARPYLGISDADEAKIEHHVMIYAEAQP